MDTTHRTNRNRRDSRMSDLLSCEECGATVSRHARQCPHCNLKPWGDVECCICLLPAHRRRAVPARTDYLAQAVTANQTLILKYDETIPSLFAHLRCYDEVNGEWESVSFRSCSACSNQYHPSVKSCPDCGHPSPSVVASDQCLYCARPVVVKQGVKWWVKYWGRYTYIHRACSRNRRRESRWW